MLILQGKNFDTIRAIIFDMDGTLIDSMDVYYGIIKDILKGFDMEMTLSKEAVFENLSRGKRLSDIIFSPGLENRDRIVERFRTQAIDAFREIFSRGEVNLIDGVDLVLEELSRRGFSLAVVTSSMAEVVVPFLKARNLHPYLDCVLGRSEVPRLKPFPDPLLKCMRIMNVESSESAYVGDSIIDIQAGKAAGMTTIGVLTGTTDLSCLREEAPDAILDSVGDLPAIL